MIYFDKKILNWGQVATYVSGQALIPMVFWLQFPGLLKNKWFSIYLQIQDRGHYFKSDVTADHLIMNQLLLKLVVLTVHMRTTLLEIMLFGYK